MSNPLSLGLGLAVLIAGSAGAAAQTTIVIPGGGYAPISPAQRAYIETYVVQHPVPPAEVPGGYVATVGGVIPAGVELRRFGPAPAYGSYGRWSGGRYVGNGYAGNGYGGGYDSEPGYGDGGGYDTADYDAGPGPAYGGAYGGGYDLSQYRYVAMPGNEAAVVEPRTRRIILIIE